MSLILGIESSCDETAAALVTSERRMLAHKLAGQESAHRPFGGVVPEIAARAHVEILPRLIEDVLSEAGVSLQDVDAIAATAGPGLIGGVLVGLVTAKGLAFAAGKPLIAVNHLEGHALSPMLSQPELEFPYLLLLVSGGHCQLLSVEGLGRIGASPRRSTMPPARHSTRPRNCSVSASRAARPSRRRPKRAIPGP
jgi:N6-L-threonylcarbamoyladenine synthase